MSSTEFDEAASISITSSELADGDRDAGFARPHGVTVGPSTQFRHAARIFAIDVLPVARADEQVRVVDAVTLDGVGQRAHDVLLSATSAKVRGR